MTTITAEDLVKLRELAQAATLGPWEWWTSNSVLRLTGADGRDGGVLYAYARAHAGHADVQCSAEDQAFIAAANPAAILALLDQLEAANGRLDCVYQLAMVTPFIAPIASKERWLESIDRAIATQGESACPATS